MKNALLIKYLIFFYSFFISFLLSALLIIKLPLNFSPTVNPDLLPYYQPYIITDPSDSIKYLLFIIMTLILTAFIYHFLKKHTFISIKSGNFLLILFWLSVLVILTSTFILIWKTYLQLKELGSLIILDPVIFHPVFWILFILGLITASVIYFFPLRKTISSTMLHKIFVLVMLVVIFLAVLDRPFKELNIITPNMHQYTHTVSYVAPIYDVLQGKVILTNSSSQYGLFSVYFPAVFFKVIKLSFTNFYYFLVGLAFFYYCCLFLILIKRLSLFWATTGILTLFTFHFYAAVDRYLRPMMFPLRYLLDMPFFLLLLLSISYPKKIYKRLIPLFLALAIFYNIETGISLSFVYLIYLLINSFSDKEKSLKLIFLPVLSYISTLSLFIILVILLHSLYSLLLTGLLPNWEQFFFYVRSLGPRISGKINLIGIYIFPLIIYLYTVIHNLIYHKKSLEQKFNNWDLTLALYGLMILIYYIEKPYIINLAAVSIPAAVLSVIYLQELYKQAKQIPLSQKLIFFCLSLVLSALIVFANIYAIYRLINKNQYNYWAKIDPDSDLLYEKIDKATEFINKNKSQGKNIYLLSFFDTYLAMKTDTVINLPHSTSQNVITYKQVDDIYNQITSSSPEQIFADNDGWLDAFKYTKIYNYLKNNYLEQKKGDYLSLWVKK